ncbi:hypothetical protein NDU88_004630 [Pleurodeles waltl]|uniref:Uncharacterized protein n=1 Tax=Pleurodeles waltl TaxID=8319 RepID=A0AAV7QD48_PLEWA|nr:hypothetical protein NDU88_004630 [Pleurodeles waltl]
MPRRSFRSRRPEEPTNEMMREMGGELEEAITGDVLCEARRASTHKVGKNHPKRLKCIMSCREPNKQKRLKPSATVGTLEAAKLPQTHTSALNKRVIKR